MKVSKLNALGVFLEFYKNQLQNCPHDKAVLNNCENSKLIYGQDKGPIIDTAYFNAIPLRAQRTN